MSEASEKIGFREGLRGFGPLGLVSILVIFLGVMVAPPIGAVLVLVWVVLSGTPWRDIGYVRPGSWIGGLVAGAVFGVALKIFMKAVVMPYLGAPDQNPAYQYMVGNAKALGEFLVYVIIGAGFAEETFFRGYLFERLGKILGPGALSKALIVIATSALFGVAHWQQGLPGIEQATIVGFVLASIFAVTGRIWFLMVAHAAFDFAAALMIYFNLEAKVAHLVFP